MKKFLSLLLAAMMIFSVLPTAALADGMKTLDMAPVGEAAAPAEEPAAESAVQDASEDVAAITNIVAQHSPLKSHIVPDFEFSPNKSDYKLSVSDATSAYVFAVTIDKIPAGKTVYAQIYKNGEPLKKNGAVAGSTYQKFTATALTKALSVMKAYLPEVGTSAKYTIILGTKVGNISGNDFETKYCEYNIDITSDFPGFSSFSAADEAGSALTLSPKFSSALVYQKDYAVTVPMEASAVKITAKTASTGVKVQIGENVYDELNAQSIELAPFATEDAATYKIPITLKKEGTTAENTYTLTVSKKDFVPVIETQPASVTCNKNEEVKLSVGVKAPEEGTLSYQWLNGSGLEIAGATEAVYMPSTERAGTYRYSCVVTNTRNGVKYIAKTETAVVTVKLNTITAPEIKMQPGTYRRLGTELILDYKTEYLVGESLDLIYIGMDLKEEGENYRYKWYYTTDGSTENETLLQAKYGGGTDASGVLHEMNTIDKKFVEGTYYIYCEVTAYSKEDRTLTAKTVSEPFKVTFKRLELEGFSGTGSETDPYLIQTADDLVRLHDVVEERKYCTGVYFKMTNDITLPEGWESIGNMYYDGEDARNLPYFGYRVFRGIFDGDNHTITVPEGGKPLFNFVSDATIRNLKIYGKRIDGDGLIDGCMIDYGTDNKWNYGDPACVTIENVRLLSGSSTFGSGFMNGSGSGINTITIRDSVVEENVVIGYTKDQPGLGSFVGGNFNGVIENCTSYASIYGKYNLGGIAASKGQTMGLCKIIGCKFYGEIVATGNTVGGIIAQGYDDGNSAPNSPWVAVEDCVVKADLTGKDYVGGIFGSEDCVMQCWGNDFGSDEYNASSSGRVVNNVFNGTIHSDGKYVGGIFGIIKALNRFTVISNNRYNSDCGAEKGIGYVRYVDTSCPTHETESGAVYFDTSVKLPGLPGVVSRDHNRTDDPLGADADKLTRAVENEDKVAAKAVEDMIAALQPVTKDSGEAIKAARDAYNALTEGQKALVSKEALDTLVKAEKIYDMIIASNKPAASDKGDKANGSVIKISATGAAKGEQNPNTGAEVFGE